MRTSWQADECTASDPGGAAGPTADTAAGRLLLALRHGNQLAFDTGLAELECDERTRDLVAALCRVAGDAVRRAHPAPEAGDRVLRRLAASAAAPPGERWVETDEDAAPHVAVLIEAVEQSDTEAVQDLVRATPDTTFVLGKLVHAVSLLLPAVPRPYLRRVLAELRDRDAAWSRAPQDIG
ncbi:hypothetical protein GCM10023347_35960 [Streptomyces chumphonensis]|uniref:Uncharacterized protein n=1 Tax=Streptomyces chumphonensis TaxID=1214925 RepID=A0A927EWD9_9ACTN|nr:hypothetical protein [Streptomyces chumphonensis]MBD3930866.1 hypothetical protein [Streptomyces chumphonensis]